MTEFPVEAVRRAVIEALPVDTSLFGGAPSIEHLYIPPGHAKALRPECNLVVGTRGAGKSTWTASLGDTELRKSIGAIVPELENTQVYIGCSEKQDVDAYPDPATFGMLRGAGIPPSTIWQAIIVRNLDSEGIVPKASWKNSTAWIRDNPEPLAKILSGAVAKLKKQRTQALFVFDALDRLGDDWLVLDENTKALLQTTLWLRPFQVISAKVFLREDQFARNVTNFPDSSKILATRVELSWALNDLHGLLWQRLINAPGEHGELLRRLFQKHCDGLMEQGGRRWELPSALKIDGAMQRALFEVLAGSWMGTDKRRGVPYHWSVGHLADGSGRTSPRSFLAAIRQAAEDSMERYPDYKLPLHYESIKRGIQKASRIRVEEMQEDYPWVPVVMESLSGLTVPCNYDVILGRWDDKYADGSASVQSDRLPPEHRDRGWDGIRDDLVRIGIFQVKKDSRIDMPDLYRVGFALGRRGGVRPRS